MPKKKKNDGWVFDTPYSLVSFHGFSWDPQSQTVRLHGTEFHEFMMAKMDSDKKINNDVMDEGS